ncbi:MAG TPA: TetR/AcrR family transcriptional regulator [Anaeromyxobacteraceae bacterium]|nr:TetR/AcrR family transcriptional regulator [Anaeromyxobacteraceae bacterium]
MKQPSTADRRVQRTRASLRQALVELLAERGWDGFSVQDVCDRANVGRSTFYTHFADKEELVAGSFDDLRRALRAGLPAPTRGPRRPLAFTRGLIEHGLEQRRVFLAIVGKRSGLVVQRRFRDLVLGLVREDLAAGPAGVVPREAVVAFVGGALLEVLTWALEAKGTPDAAELDALFHRLVAPVLVEAGVLPGVV